LQIIKSITRVLVGLHVTINGV